jgi:N-acetylneuraminate synthase
MVEKNFVISNLIVGKNYPSLIIPEIGINHSGNIEKAFNLVDSAKRAGAKIIKHQTHIFDDEMSIEAKKVIPGNSKKNIYEIIKNCSLNEEEEYKLFLYVKKKKMVFLSTPFSYKAVDRLIKFKVPAFKIGSGEFHNTQFIEYVAKFKKPMILSTGMNNMDHIKKVYNMLKKIKTNFCFMHTTSVYPTPDKLVRLDCINLMKKNFPDIIIGYSDHSVSSIACESALSMRALIIEKHFTDTKSRKGPDIVCSIDEKGLRNLINRSITIFSQFRGKKNLLNEEIVTKNFAFTSVVSNGFIKKGEKLSKKNLVLKRPGNGHFNLNNLKFLQGKVAKKDIPENTQIKKNHI